MTSPLETKARALAEQIASEAVEQVEEGVEVFDRFSVPKALPFLLAFASEVERETLERAAAAICWGCAGRWPGYAHAQRYRASDRFLHYRANTNDFPSECTASAVHVLIRSLSEPPAETPEPKG